MSRPRSYTLPFVFALLAFGLCLVGGVGSAADPAGGAHAEGGHSDPFAFVLLELAAIVAIAMLGRWLAGRLNQPSVLGELLIGVVVGNIGYWAGEPLFVLIMHMGDVGPLYEEVWRSGESVAESARHLFTSEQLAEGGVADKLLDVLVGPGGPRLVDMGVALTIFSSLGVILLLFMVGLESSVAEMKKVGPRATMVALIGIVAPFALGMGVGVALLPEESTPAHLFLAATLCATSVGITARVFKDLGRIQTSEAKVILGAAVIDDVLGLIILAIVVGIASTGQVQLGEVARTTLLSGAFLGAVILFGERAVRWGTPIFESLDRHHGKLLFPLAVAFLLSWVANQVQLASIVGAFAAGLVLDEKYFAQDSAEARSLEELFAPLEAIFAPIFFVLMGMQVNLAAFASAETGLVALVLTVAAIAGKLVSGAAAGQGIDRLSVGIGMIPRGEVGLIFASIGKAIGVVGDALFSAIVVMVMATTLITPIWLRWSLYRKGAGG